VPNNTIKHFWKATIADPFRENVGVFLADRRILVWALSLAVGILAGYATLGFRLAIEGVEFFWLETMAEKTATAARALPWWVILSAPATAGLIVGICLDRWASHKRTYGVADTIEASAVRDGHIPFRQGLLSALLTVISLGGGASAGREGPAVHLGATLASGITRHFALKPEARRILLSVGVAAAVSASFNAPLAGVLFAHEIVLTHYALRAFVPTTIGAVAGTVITRIHLGDTPAFTLPSYEITSYLEFPAFALLGIVCALIAISFLTSIFTFEKIANKWAPPLWARPMLGGLAVGAMAISFPEILGVGYEATDNALQGNYGLGMLIALLLLKGLATSITLAARFGGGIFTPSLYLGAMTGGAFGLIAASFQPELASDQGLYAIIGMGAVSGAVLGAPISTTLIVFELIGSYEVTIAILLAVSIATALTQAVIGKSFFHWQLQTRDLHLHEGPHRRILLSLLVRDMMVWHTHPIVEDMPPVADEKAPHNPALHPNDNVGKALALMDRTDIDPYPISHPERPQEIIGELSHKEALKRFNHALTLATKEEHS
jgi:CIC family chloride channel protein